MNYTRILHEIGCRPPTNPSRGDVEWIESQIGVRLPAAYREFLHTCGGWWGDVLTPCREPTPFGGEHWITGFHDASAVGELLNSMITPRNMITIAFGHFSKYTCLAIAGIDHGAIYALDGEFRADWSDAEFHQRYNAMDDEIREYLQLRKEDKLLPKPVGYDSVYLLAKDFDEFIQACRPSPEA